MVGVHETDKTIYADVCLVEVGGTVGDLESGAYFEAIR
jgi:CTP synthase (UTP-ammonia lyase)